MPSRTKINTPKESVFRYEKAKELFLKERKFDLKSLKKVLVNHDKKY